VDELAASLSPDERDRAGAFVRERDRRHFTVGRGVLRAILSRYAGIPPKQVRFCYGPHGKPALDEAHGGQTLRFNLAHSHDLALYAVTRGREIGVDLEWVGRPVPDAATIAEHYFSAAERARLRALPELLRHEAFYNCWTRKEAYLKARGEGLSLPLDQFDVSLAPGEPAALLSSHGDPGEVVRWTLWALIPGPGYVAALAVEGGDWQLECWDWEARR
jgi:4'-phosphopantetheinyl transferase